ncbi:hypothetical protein HDU82_007401 [Entophlyctis luteolus]|nr:hypothetical protein HDU82_007401 [Entophlyctis luteolus]
MGNTNKTYVNLPTVLGGPAPSEIEFEGGSIAFEDSGADSLGPNGKIFYLLPGIGDFRHTYRFLAPKLVASGHRVICQDLRGVGDSGTKFSSFLIEDCARDVVGVLDHLQIYTPVVLMGNSLSAAVVVSVASDHPDRVAAIVSTGGFFRDMPNGNGSTIVVVVLIVSCLDPAFRLLAPLLFNHLWGQPMWIMAFRGFFGKQPADIDQYCNAVKEKMLSNCDHASVISSMMRASKQTAWSKVPNLKCPVLLIMGSKDPDFSDPLAENKFVAENMMSRAPGIQVQTKIIEGSGHYPHNEFVEETFSSLVSFATA